jgi:3-phosphoshikimate 1-carboxyvinyltransferase
MRSVSQPGTIRASLAVPPDKSLSHRALLFNAIATGTARVDNLLDSEDVRSTAACLAALGASIDWPEDGGTATVTGAGLHGLTEASDVLDCGNSGTTMRLLSGLLAGQPFLSVLTGDASLRRRPMRRIIEPLQRMGATLDGRAEGTLPPLVIRGGGLGGLKYETPVASAQVKSAILLAGLYADGPTTVIEPSPSRDHTERLLTALGASLVTDGTAVTITPGANLRATGIRVPGDISSAAPWLVLAACHPDAEVLVQGVNVNPSRTGLLDILRAMGADIVWLEERVSGGEPIADIRVRSSRLTGCEIGGDTIPRAVDEIPLVALLACFADGETVVRDAAELRVKESDRIEATVSILHAMGARIDAMPDGFRIAGQQRLSGARLDAGGDHRIGMLAAIAGMLASGETSIANDAVGVSYPGFWHDVESVTAPQVSTR